MGKGEQLSARLTSLAMEAAYESNKAYDALMQAQATHTKLGEVVELGLDGVVVSDEAVDTASQKVEKAQLDFDTFSGIAGAVAMMGGESGDSPLSINSIMPSDEADKRTPSLPRGEGKVSPSLQERMDAILICLIDKDGRVAKTDDKSAGSIIVEATGLNKDSWSSPRKKLVELGLINLEKAVPTARAFTAVSLNEDKLSALVEQGDLSQAVIEALENRETHKESSAASGETETGGPPDFLADKGGEEPEAEGSPSDESSGAAEEVEEILIDDDSAEIDTGEEIEIEDSSLEDELGSIRIRHQPAKRRTRSSGGGDKNFSFDFEAGGRPFSRSIRTWQLRKLPNEVRMLLGFGQVAKFEFYKTEEQRREFVLRIVNKGVEDEAKLTDEAGLSSLIEGALERGYLHQNGNGLELTGAGVDFVRGTKFGRAKLGQKEAKPSQKETKERVHVSAGSDLARATLVA